MPTTTAVPTTAAPTTTLTPTTAAPTTTLTPTTTTETPITTTPPPCDDATTNNLEENIKTLLGNINDLKEQIEEIKNNSNELSKKYFEPNLLCFMTKDGDLTEIKKTIRIFELRLNELYSQKYLIENSNQVIIYKDDEQGNPVEEIKTDKTFIENQLKIIDRYITYNNEILEILEGNKNIDNKSLAAWCQQDNSAYEENMNYFKNTIDSLTAEIENKKQEIKNKNNYLNACGKKSIVSNVTENWKIKDFYNNIYKRTKFLESI